MTRRLTILAAVFALIGSFAFAQDLKIEYQFNVAAADPGNYFSFMGPIRYMSALKDTIDATTGQNAVNQAREFMAAVPVTGIALSKLDGTAKGGIVITIKDELGLPIKLAGSGETLDDLDDFDPQSFVEALFER